MLIIQANKVLTKYEGNYLIDILHSFLTVDCTLVSALHLHMANSTDPLAHNIHGTNPQVCLQHSSSSIPGNLICHLIHHCQQNLIEKITREKIYDTPFWKEMCFGISAESLVDLASNLRAYGGVVEGGKKATNFMCLTLKMLQLQPSKEIILEFIKNDFHKYARLLGALYLRLVGRPVEIFQYLEPLLNDFRRVRHHTREGRFGLNYFDVLVAELLHKDSFCGIVLPRIPGRQVLEDIWQLEPRASALACVNERTTRSSPGSVDLSSEKYITLEQRDLDIQHQKQKDTSNPQHTKKSGHHLRENRYLEINFCPRKRVKHNS